MIRKEYQGLVNRVIEPSDDYEQISSHERMTSAINTKQMFSNAFKADHSSLNVMESRDLLKQKDERPVEKKQTTRGETPMHLKKRNKEQKARQEDREY